MTEKTAQRVSELYKEKSSIFTDLEKLINTKDYSFNVAYEFRGATVMYGYSGYNNLSQEFREKIKKQTIEFLENRIKEIDNELEKL